MTSLFVSAVSSRWLSAVPSNPCSSVNCSRGSTFPFCVLPEMLTVLRNSAVNLPKAWKSLRLSNGFFSYFEEETCGQFLRIQDFLWYSECKEGRFWNQIKLGPSLNFCSILGWNSLVLQLVKNQPVMQETLVWSLRQADPLQQVA